MSSIPQMTRAEAIQPPELYALLARWFESSAQATIGDVTKNQGRVPWVWVRAAGRDCRLHADTTREGVGELLRLWRASGQRLEWHVVPNQRGVLNKLSFGSAKTIIPGLYAYLHEPASTRLRLL